MIEDPDDRRPRELRIHGVGGSPGPRLLGFDLPTSVETVGEGVGGTVVIARRDDGTVEGYDWGDLTSGSGTQPFWVFLLPFTVLNAAGWMHPTTRGLKPLCRAMVHVLSVLLSLTYVFSLALLLVDLVGYQWTRRVFCPNRAAGCAHETVIIQQRLGVALGMVLLLVAVGALVVIAGRTQVRFERIPPPRALRERAKARTKPPESAAPEGLADPDFFWRPQYAKWLLRVHLVALALGWLAVGAVTLRQMFSHPSNPSLHHSLHLDRLLVVVNVPSAVAVGLLWLGWIVAVARRPSPGRSRWQPASAGPAIAATMAYVPLVAVYSGTLLVVVKRLSDWPKRTMHGVPGLDVGGAVAFVDVWGGVIVAAALLAGLAALLLARKPHGQTDDIPDRTSQAGRPLDGADPLWCARIASKRSVAWLAHQADWAALFVALGLWLTAVVSFLIRTRWFHHITVLSRWFHHNVPANPSSPLYSIGAYVLALAPFFVYSLVRKSRGRPTVISTIWDVLTFLPRSFAPLAVRCYAERAVPEFQGRIDYHIRKFSQPVVISAHSQGSIIAFAAVASLPDDYARNVALVTYGSPITTIFGRFFPEYFGSDAVAKVRAKLPDPAPDTPGWRNFYRLTDPIGGRVFEPQPATEAPRDIELADPMPPPPVPWPPLPGEAPLEHDRPLWTQIAVHSYYLNEPELKHWVARLKAAMGTPAAPGGPGAPSQGDGTVVNVAKG